MSNEAKAKRILANTVRLAVTAGFVHKETLLRVQFSPVGAMREAIAEMQRMLDALSACSDEELSRAIKDALDEKSFVN